MCAADLRTICNVLSTSSRSSCLDFDSGCLAAAAAALAASTCWPSQCVCWWYLSSQLKCRPSLHSQRVNKALNDIVEPLSLCGLYHHTVSCMFMFSLLITCLWLYIKRTSLLREVIIVVFMQSVCFFVFQTLCWITLVIIVIWYTENTHCDRCYSSILLLPPISTTNTVCLKNPERYS